MVSRVISFDAEEFEMRRRAAGRKAVKWLGHSEWQEEGFMVIISSQIDSFRASMRTAILIKVVQELILLV